MNKRIAILAAILVSGPAISLASATDTPPSAQQANGRWRLPPADCYPSIDDYDHRYRIDDGPDAIIWWCDAPEGLQPNYRTGNYGNAGDSRVLAAINIDHDIVAIDAATFHRASTDEELSMVWELQRLYQPRCYPEATAAAAAVYSSEHNKLGAPRTGSDGRPLSIANQWPVACGWKLEESQRYCLASNLNSTSGEMIPLNSWVACRMERAPADGWPDAQKRLTAGNKVGG